ncbi:NAD(P)/FAD-dependent oxidoreductase [Trinickia acidisoli]|uniref:NAD(P)/FAD-dependent oxidoreductase n=1 Tax=Trinickia acidisoli TaxID=2767482 RepID=UPI001A8DFE97|nr:FAD-dependent oxidoreductase [Trinickia acidisoli]
MQILILDHLNGDLANHILAKNVVYRPDVLSKGRAALRSALMESNVDAVVTRAPLPSDVVAAWADGQPEHRYYVSIGNHGDAADAGSFGSAVVLPIADSGKEDVYIEALKTLEHAFTGRYAERHSASLGRASASRRVTLIGGGLVNLITAHYLSQHDYEVEIIDARPDPRTDASWTSFACSRGGDDARMFTLSEMDNYNAREIHETMNTEFQRTVSDRGWATYHAGSLSREEHAWVAEFESIPTWLADSYNDDIFSLTRESKGLWDAWIDSDPELFQDSLIRDGVLRIYSDVGHFEAAIARQKRIGAARSVLSGDEVAREQPALAAAVEGGHIVGGVNVVGFTINAHKFMRQLLDRLEANGVRTHWNRRAQHLMFDARGDVTGVRLADELLLAENVVISPGAYGDTLLKGTASEGKINGVIGAWLRLPNLDEPLRNSLKLARKGHVTEDANITVATDENGKPIMIIGSGYGYTGVDASNIDRRLLKVIYDGLIDTAQKYFPHAYQAAMASGDLESGLKYCVRPWTSSSLGIFETIPTARAGYCVVTGGHNTGGFAQAPAIGRAVVAALTGQAHPMHTLYRPDRSSMFLASSQSRPATRKYA